MSIVFLRKNIGRINTALLDGLITTEEAAQICEYSNSKSFLAAYRQVTGKTLTRARVENYLDGAKVRMSKVLEKSDSGNSDIVGFFELTGHAWEVLAKAIRQKRPDIVLDSMKFRGIIYANDFCRVVVTGEALAEVNITPVLGFTAGCDLRTIAGYVMLPGAESFTNQELSALMRGK